MSNENETGLPLADVKVIECCHTVMGPTCGLILADLGAEVIKVEPASSTGEPTRTLQGFQVGSFSYFNRNKKSVAINLKTEQGRALVHDLVRDADVFLENYAPGAAERIGIGYTELSQLNPRLIYCSLKGYLPGPFDNRAALDEVVQFQSGLAYMTGPPGMPLRTGASVIDMLGGIFGAMGILAALRMRDATGRGRKVQSSLFVSAVFLVGQHMAAKAVTGTDPIPFPIKKKTWAIYETFEARDGVVFIAITSDAQWKRFWSRFDWPDLVENPAYATNVMRLAHHAVLREEVHALVSQWDIEPLIGELTELGVPIAPVGKPTDLFDNEHLNGRNGLLPTTMLDGSKSKLPSLPMEIEGVQFSVRQNPPQVSEHLHEIMASIGLSAETIEEYKKMRILRCVSAALLNASRFMTTGLVGFFWAIRISCARIVSDSDLGSSIKDCGKFCGR